MSWGMSWPFPISETITEEENGDIDDCLEVSALEGQVVIAIKTEKGSICRLKLHCLGARYLADKLILASDAAALMKSGGKKL